MDDQRPVVQCMYKSKRQFEQHAVLMLESGYVIHAVNGYRPHTSVDRASVRAFMAADIDRLYGTVSSPAGIFSVSYRLTAQRVLST